MSSEMINRMVQLVSEEGYTPKSVWESSLSIHIGSTARVNKTTTATEYQTGNSLSVPEDTVVTVIGVGGGHSGADHHVLLPDGRQAVIPFYDLGEGFEKEGEENTVSEGLTGAVAKVSLTKPLPQSALEWLKGGYMDYGVSLPGTPSDDSEKAVSFMMKSEDQGMLDSALEALKKVAGATFKSSAAATLTDWNKAVSVR